jgi:phosphoribosylaminoimidazole (AIR) synthetase
MLRTINGGLGMVLVLPPERAEACARALGGHLVGEVVPDPDQAVVLG